MDDEEPNYSLFAISRAEGRTVLYDLDSVTGNVSFIILRSFNDLSSADSGSVLICQCSPCAIDIQAATWSAKYQHDVTACSTNQ